MISATDKAMCLGRIEIGYKPLVGIISSFGCLHEYELNGELSLSGLFQHLPIDVPLIVGNVDAVYLIAMWHTYPITFHSIARFPAIGIRPDKEIVENARKDNDNQEAEEILVP